MKFKVIAFFLFINCVVYSQKIKLDAKIDEPAFFIEYPKSWKIDTTGRNGSSFYLFAEKKGMSDNFGENINLIIQNIESLNLNIDTYTEISEQQVKASGNLIESKRVKIGGIESQRLIYEFTVKDFKLRFLQYYLLKNGKAYILTYTAKSDTYDKYVSVAEKIFTTFKVK